MVLSDVMDDFRIAGTEEVQALLRQIAEAGTLLNLSSPDGCSYTTALWAVDGPHQRISFSADAGHPQLQGLIDAGEATVVGYHAAVKVQFDLNGLMLVHGQRGSALQAEMPTEVFRFQRRLSFRVRTLPRSSPVVRLRHPSLPDMQFDLRVIDVSIGGCALLLPDNVPPLSPGVRVQGTQVELDIDTRFEATLQLEHVTSLNPGAYGVRLGCSLQDLSGDAQRALQRYIDQTQKRRKLMQLDP